MPFESIKPGGPSAPSAAEPSNPPTGSEAANRNTVSVEEALKGADHTKSGIFSVTDLSKQPNGPTLSGTPSGSSVTAGQLISGKIAVDMMDAIFPAILVVVFAKIGMSIKKSSLQLTQGEKNTLQPIMEACLNTINMNFSSPWQALIVTMAFIYGGKALEVGGVGWLDKKAEEAGKQNRSKSENAETGKAETKVVPIAGAGVSGVQQSTMPSNADNNMDFHPDGPTPWTKADVAKVEKKRKKGPREAEEWLRKNWAKKGGVI